MSRYDSFTELHRKMQHYQAILNGSAPADALHEFSALENALDAMHAHRDAQLLELIGLGFTRAQIADALGVSPSAVAQQVRTARTRHQRRRREAT
jgi:DNA-binding CsgD family transcriptional regulator